MRVSTVAIGTALAVVLVTSCSHRLAPIECVRFDADKKISLLSLAENLTDHYPGFELTDYKDSLTQGQSLVGEAWIVARFDAVELSVRNHEGEFSDVCAYDHSNGVQSETAREALQVVRRYLDEHEVAYTTL